MNEQILYNRPLPGARLNMAHPLTQGLVGCWLLNENGGVRAMDLSPYGNHGLLTSFATPPKRSFNGLLFDGVDDYVLCTTTEADLATFTAEAWFNPSTTVVAQYNLIGHGSSPTDNGWNFAQNGTGLRITFAGVGNYDSTADILSVGKWYQGLMTLLGTTATFYLNGQLINSAATGALAVATHKYALGATPGGATLFGGFIALARVYNRVLNATEIKQLYQDPYGMILKRED